MDNEIQKLAEELYQEKSVLIMGRGYHYATCLEGALVSPNSSIPHIMADILLKQEILDVYSLKQQDFFKDVRLRSCCIHSIHLLN